MLRIAAVWVVSFVTAAAFCAPAFRDLDNLGLRDWDQHVFYHAVARQAIVEYAQVPGWNPYYFGGTACLANPQSRVFSPSFLLVLWLGEVRGLKVDIWLHLAIGLAGTYVLARHWSLSVAAAAAAAASAFLNSMYLLNVSAGHTWFMTAAYAPWTWLCWRRGRERSLRWNVATGAWFALAWLGGGAYVVAIVGTLLAIDLAATFSRRHWKTELAALGVTAVSAASLGAVKLLPSLHFMSLYPRKTDTWSGYSFWGLMRSLLHPDQSFAAEAAMPQLRGTFWEGFNFGQDENGMYVGFVGAGLVVLGLLSRPGRELWLPWGVLLWLMFGERVWPSLWEWVHEVPPFDSMRVAMRFRIAWILPTALLAGIGLDGLARGRGWLGWGVAAVLWADLWNTNGRLLEGALVARPAALPARARFVQLRRAPPFLQPADLPPNAAGGSMSHHYATFRANIGVIDGYEVIPIPKHAVGEDEEERYRGELYLHSGNGSARFVRWSPNEWQIETTSATADRLVINQNDYPGWVELERGRPVESFDGLISVPVAAGRDRVTLRYQPPWLTTGFWTSVVAMVFWSIWVIRPFLCKSADSACRAGPEPSRVDGERSVGKARPLDG